MTMPLLAIPTDDGLGTMLPVACLADYFLDFNGHGQMCVWRHNPARPHLPIEWAGLDDDIDPEALTALTTILAVPVFEGLAAVLGVRRPS